MDNLVWLVLQWVVVIFLSLVGILLIYKMWIGEIDLNSLVSETATDGVRGKASLSRFQMLLFTFVIVSIYVVLCLQEGELLEISGGVLGLLGISGGSYVISK